MTLIRHGDTGYPVEAIQRDLARHGLDLAIDGVFGPATEAAVRRFQREHGLVIDGVVGRKTRRALTQGDDPKALRQIDLVGAAETLEVDLAAVMAVNEVESRGVGMHHGGPRNGEPVILFERHIMRRRLEHHGVSPVEYERSHPSLVNAKPGGYIGGHREHDRLDQAAYLHPTSAIESASWGLFQIMGFHWERLGYRTVGDWANAMAHSEARQLEAFVRFIEADRALHRALKEHDWRDFARRYNGPAYAKNDYDTKLAAAHRRHSHDLERAA
ncbi:N-acetylmuramidase domain-containing protein [Billgrantia gudaonensis]|uniref:Putative peptidoglycan binding domain-containing protein n=1 Tax=Billgrantia gudaonensis TaxID=376427 RepID=A0A1G8TKB3_9GAMM|nr:N-acetylmuramidase family protein [Halomonas gudaonensis]SDJ41355.1 Putative peptidoglycan binding domain-containing protein [Halomonas gudaonensis]